METDRADYRVHADDCLRPMYSYLCDKMKSATMNKAVLMYQASRLIDPLHCNAKGDKDRKQRNVT